MVGKESVREDLRYAYYQQELPDSRLICFREPKWDWVMSAEFLMNSAIDKLDNAIKDYWSTRGREDMGSEACARDSIIRDR